MDAQYCSVVKTRGSGRAISAAARAFARARLSPRSIAWYWADLLGAYGGLQRFNVTRRDASGAPVVGSSGGAGAVATATDGRTLCTCWYLNTTDPAVVELLPHAGAAPAPGVTLPLQPFTPHPALVPPWVTLPGALHCGVFCRPNEVARLPGLKKRAPHKRLPRVD